MYSSLYSFTNDDIINLLKKYGLDIKVERGNRVFPVSDKSSDVIKAFKELLMDSGVKLKLSSNVKSIDYQDNKFKVKVDNESLEFDGVIIATGGKSYPLTGSTGDGYRFAKNLGHRIIPLKPSLVPLVIDGEWLKDLQGLSLRNVRLKTLVADRLVHEEFGEMLFTHFGISGPIALTTSNYINRYHKDKLKLMIDLKPALDFNKLDNRILRDFEEYKNRQVKMPG